VGVPGAAPCGGANGVEGGGGVQRRGPPWMRQLWAAPTAASGAHLTGAAGVAATREDGGA
jgi:hypothetical protein